MDPNQPDLTGSFGRGRPMGLSDLRRPFGYTYAPDAQFVPAEGSNNILQLNPTTMAEMGRQTAVHNGDAAVFQVGPAGDFVPSQNNLGNGGGDKMGSEVNSVLSPYAPEFVPRNFRPEPRTNQVQAGYTSDRSNDSYPIEKLRQFLFEITLNPGKFESKIEQLIDCFNEYICNDDTVMRSAVHIIFDESVRQPNFRYNGARLVKYFCEDLKTLNQRNFLQIMLARCRMEHRRRENLCEAEDGGVYLRGLTMFLAEMFSQIDIHNNRIKMMGEYLISLMETLLSNPTTDNLKCVCQVLKLVGVYLEDQERKTNSGAETEMDKIMVSLKNVTQNTEFSNDIRSMVSNVVELRSSNWGRASEEEPEIEEIPPPASVNEPVMYGPDGKPISDEESVFLHSQYSNSASDAEDYDALEDDGAYDGMSEEILAAYEVYLREVQQ